MRIKRGAPRSSERLLRSLHAEAGVVRGADAPDIKPDIKKDGIAVTVDVMGDRISDLIGYKARRVPDPIDVDKVDHYEPADYWEPVARPKNGGIVLETDDFHILASKETISIPTDYAADMIAYDTLVGEFRVHYAGFFDPGFGWSPGSRLGARAVLEVRSHDVAFMLEDGQTVGRLALERLTEATEKPYGQEIGSSYQNQGLALSKQFRR